MSKKSNVAEAPIANEAEGTALFPMPSTPLGKACEKFVEITSSIADLKVKRTDAEGIVLQELHLEKRDKITVTVGNDNWTFEIKPEGEKIRCVKATRQPVTKVVVTEE